MKYPKLQMPTKICKNSSRGRHCIICMIMSGHVIACSKFQFWCKSFLQKHGNVNVSVWSMELTDAQKATTANNREKALVRKRAYEHRMTESKRLRQDPDAAPGLTPSVASSSQDPVPPRAVIPVDASDDEPLSQTGQDIAVDEDELQLCSFDMDGAMSSKSSRFMMKPNAGPKNFDETFAWGMRYMENLKFYGSAHGRNYATNLKNEFRKGIVFTTRYTGSFGGEGCALEVKNSATQFQELSSANFVLYSACDCSLVSQKVAGGLTKEVKPLHMFDNILGCLPVVILGSFWLSCNLFALGGATPGFNTSAAVLWNDWDVCPPPGPPASGLLSSKT